MSESSFNIDDSPCVEIQHLFFFSTSQKAILNSIRIQPLLPFREVKSCRKAAKNEKVHLEYVQWWHYFNSLDTIWIWHHSCEVSDNKVSVHTTRRWVVLYTYNSHGTHHQICANRLNCCWLRRELHCDKKNSRRVWTVELSASWKLYIFIYEL